MATRDPPKKRREKRLKVPDHTISDISAYMAQIAEKLNESAGQVSGSTDASGSSYSDSDSRGPVTGNVIPGSPGSPKVRMVEEFMRHTDESGDWLKKWYSENYEKVENYEYIRFELLYFLSDYMPGIKVDENIDARNLVELVKSLVLDLQTKFNRFNLELQEISGHEVAGYIQDHHRKVIEVVEDYENKLKAANEELVLCKDQIAHLDAELSAALQRMMYLEKGTAYFGGFEDSVSEEQFMADLQRRVAQSDSLNSSMKEELQRERAENEGLQKQLALLAKEKVETQEKCMQEIVELSKRAEINSMLEHGIMSMLEKSGKEPNKQDCQNVINKWKNDINQVIDQNSKDIDELLKKVESQNKEMTMLQAQTREQDEKIEEMQTQRSFLPQPTMDNTFDLSNSMNETWDSHRAYSPASPLNATYSGTDDSYSSYGSRSPYGASTPVRGSPRMDRTFSPQRGSPQMDRTFSPQRGSPRMDRTFSPQRGSPRERIEHSRHKEVRLEWIEHSRHKEVRLEWIEHSRHKEVRLEWIEHSRHKGVRLEWIELSRHKGVRLEWIEHFPLKHTYNHLINSMTHIHLYRIGVKLPDITKLLRSSYDDEAELGYQYISRGSPLYDTDESFVDDVFEEGDYPMVLRYGFSPGYGPYRQLHVDRGYYPARLHAGAEHWDPKLFDSPEAQRNSDGIVWRRPSPESIELDWYQTPGKHVRYFRDLSVTPERSGSPIMSQQLPPQVAAGTVRISPRTPAISRFSRYGYTDPQAKVFNIPPGDDLDIPSGMKKTVTITSPGKQKPLHLNVEVAPKGISQSPSGRHILCDVSVGVEEAVIKPQRYAGYFTPPVTETVRRYDRKHGMFTPRSVFKKGHYAVRNIFDVSPQAPSPRSPPLNTTIEWEHDWLNRMYGASPPGAGLNTTFTRPSPPGTQVLNRTFDLAPPGAGLNTTFTRPSPPGTQVLNRTFDLAPSGAGLNTTFTRASPPGTQELNRTFDLGPSGADLNTAFSSPSSPGIFDATFDASPQAYGYQTPSYQEPQNPVWTYPMRRNVIPVSPEQDLISAVEDEGFDYYYSPPARSPRRYYPGTN
ncbi:hypothetical protein HNY73_021573 [Argiope bruennichi]|uniref:Uncharacterized protein n=1 Tax=Argiope bruennichi TaxID=94029 RepID=A0A8T0DZY1_ARGBR|nr:hypothetical protein HNY73_021573 [Argiope bruennichi]